MSKTFRARQIDFNKPLPIIIYNDGNCPDVNEYSAINRGVPNIPSGMEKEEETEKHLQEALSHLQQFKTTEKATIPVPEIIEDEKRYKSMYCNGFEIPKQFIRLSLFLNDEEPPEYDMDSEDEEWLSNSNLGISPLEFERMIEKLEKGCGHKVMSLDEAKSLLREDPSLIIAVYDYWLNKRVKSRQAMILMMKQERRDGTSNNDPYVAFRRRTEKMQTRKNRKNDEQSYEKMVRLKMHLVKVRSIMEGICKREENKKRLIDTSKSLFCNRFQVNDWDSWCLKEAESTANKQQTQGMQNWSRTARDSDDRRPLSRKRKRAHHNRLPPPLRSLSSDGLSEPEEESEVDGPFAFVRRPGVKYQARREDIYSQWNDDPFSLEPQADRHRFQLTAFTGLVHSRQTSTTAYLRRRLGRGGRIIYDRIGSNVALPDLSDEDDSAPSNKYPRHFRPCLLPKRINSDSVDTSDSCHPAVNGPVDVTPSPSNINLSPPTVTAVVRENPIRHPPCSAPRTVVQQSRPMNSVLQVVTCPSASNVTAPSRSLTTTNSNSTVQEKWSSDTKRPLNGVKGHTLTTSVSRNYTTSARFQRPHVMASTENGSPGGGTRQPQRVTYLSTVKPLRKPQRWTDEFRVTSDAGEELS